MTEDRMDQIDIDVGIESAHTPEQEARIAEQVAQQIRFLKEDMECLLSQTCDSSRMR